jgi:hypothetical protein
MRWYGPYLVGFLGAVARAPEAALPGVEADRRR